MISIPENYIEVDALYHRTIGSGIKTLAVTSAVSGEGVSTLAESLARRATACEKKVLLVELNLFNPQFRHDFQGNSSDWQLNRHSSSSIIKHNGYQLLPAPVGEQAAMHFRQSSRLKQCIDLWLEQCDCVIFDTSPITAFNRGNIPAEVICAVCEGTLLVMLAGKTAESKIHSAINQLSTAQVNLIGCVLNDQFNPSLASELIREVKRFEKILPELVVTLCRKIKQSVFLNIPI